MVSRALRTAAVSAALAAMVIAPACRKKVYINPIAKDTQQPDKVLFDTSLSDIQHGRFERARLTLQTLMNTYDTSEYLAKAKLAVADSWFREGGSHGLAQAEAEYKDFILFYPQMEESAEAQEKVCQMQYDQIDKADRDNLHARRALDECRTLLAQYPNSKFAPAAQQYLRNTEEVLAEGENKVGTFYLGKGSFPAATNRFQGLADQYPLYSGGAEALWDLADGSHHMGDNFENQEAAAYAKIVQEYPLSAHVADAKAKLTAMHRAVPEADPVAYAREKYEQQNRLKRSLLGKATGPFIGRPDVSLAARSGSPQMSDFKPYIPVSVPAVAGVGDNTVTATQGGGGGGSDVSAGTVGSEKSLIDRQPDAREGGPAATAAATAVSPKPSDAKNATAPPAAAAGPKPLPQNHTGNLSPKQQARLLKKQQDTMRKQQDVRAKAKKKQQELDDRKKKKSGEPADNQSGQASPANSPNSTPTPATGKQ
ncbi:MAG: outer membrane protein assembly factor BamD [Bryobacteraceae bacterium]